DRVHRDAAVVRLETQPAHTTSFTVVDVLVIRVGNRTDGGGAFRTHHAQFARRQTQLGVTGVLTDELSVTTRRTGHLAAGTDLQLHVMNNGADRHVLQRHRI